MVGADGSTPLDENNVFFAVRIKKLPMGAVSEWGVNIMAARPDWFQSSFSVTYALRKKK